jgi:carboxymethylenebutenolidase
MPLDTVDKIKAALVNGTPAARAPSFVVYLEAGATAWFKANGVA